MRILSVTQSYAPFYEFGGPPVKVEALATGLAKRGHAVTVLTADWGFDKKLGTEAAGTRRSPFGWSWESRGVQSIYLPTWARYRALSWNPALKRYCRARLGQFDVVHIFGLYDLLGPRVANACTKRGIPYVVEPIGMFVPIVRNVALKKFYHLVWGRKMLESAAAIVATSQQEADEIRAGMTAAGRSLARDRIVLRRNGVAAPLEMPKAGEFRAKHGIPKEAKVVLFLGRLSKKKSPELLLNAFAKLPKEMGGGEVRLVFAGPDESGMKERLARRAKGLGVANRVSLCGAVDGEEKWSAYRDANVFVLPSQNENFGNTAVEAAACGTPIVVTKNCGVAELLNGAGIVVQHETDSVAAAVKEILENQELSDRLSQGGRVAASRLGWDEPVGVMEMLYKKLTGNPA